MKPYIITTAALIFFASACKNSGSNENAASQRDSLLTVIQERDSSMNELIVSFNEVERNLDSVGVRQKIILLNTGNGDLKGDRKARINAEIKAINSLMEANTKKLKELNRKYALNTKKNKQLEKTIVLLNDQLTLKYVELNELSAKLNQLNIEIAQLQVTTDTLILRNSMQAQRINDNINELHTAYYIVEKSAKLELWSLIDKHGGFLGIGETAKLSNNLDINMFTKIDYTQVTVIPVNSRGIKIVTTHPTGSFSLEKTGKTVNNIVISDPEKFWSASKYLVITK